MNDRAPLILARAVERHRAGRLAEALEDYRVVLALEPGNSDALHLAGLIALESGSPEQALVLIDAAVAAGPHVASYHASQGRANLALGRTAEAITSFGNAVVIEPANRGAVVELGRLLGEAGQHDVARDVFTAAVAADPQFVEAHANLAMTLRELGQLDLAAESCRNALELDPELIDVLLNLGVIEQERGNHRAAEIAQREVLRLAPGHVAANFNLGRVLSDTERFAEAEIVLRRAAASEPANPKVQVALATAERRMGRLAEAASRLDFVLARNAHDVHALLGLALLRAEERKFADATGLARRAVALAPKLAAAHSNLAHILREAGDIAGAISAYRRAVMLEPNHPEIAWNLALALLLVGEYDEGWRHYDARWRRRGVVRPHATVRRWDGGTLNGTLLLHAEQGLGDTLHFVRYATLAAQRAARVVIEAQAPLLPLLRQSLTCQVVAQGDDLPPVDAQAALLDLPRLFGTRLDSVPNHVPYLSAAADSVVRWRTRLGGHGFRVGLVWAGNPTQQNDPNRSMNLVHAEPLARIDGVRLFSLQKDLREGDAALLERFAIEPLGGELTDFAETAAAIEALDLVVSIDTSVAHLGGALGRPVWVLCCFAPDWRWMLGRDNCPWYPTMRLFRQPAPGDWDSVAAAVARELRMRVG